MKKKYTKWIMFILIICALPAIAQEAKISIPNSSGMPGDTVTIPVEISDANAIIGVDLKIEYNSQILEFLEVNMSPALASNWQMLHSTNIAQRIGSEGEIESYGEIEIHAIISFGEFSGNTTFVNIDFAIEPTAQLGEITLIKLIQADLNEVAMQSQDGQFTIGDGTGGSGIPGDVNGDSEVNRQDLLLLIISYKKGSFDNAYNPSADFNKDGPVDKQDLEILIENFGRRN